MPYHPTASGEASMPGELRLLAAFLHRCVEDARRPGKHREAARAFLEHGQELQEWCELIGADAERVAQRLRQAAGITEPEKT